MPSSDQTGPLCLDSLPAATPATKSTARVTTATPSCLEDNRAMAATMLATRWPDKGRHALQNHFAGALVRGGLPDEEATSLLCQVCKFAGDEDPGKRAQSVADARAKHTAGLPYTGWTSLAEALGEDLVRAVRTLMALPKDGPDPVMASLFTGKTPEAAPAPANDNVLFTFGGWSTSPAPVEYVVDGLIAKASVNMFVAHGDSMKTWTLLSMMLAIASGKPWLGRYPVKRGRVAYLDYENGRHEVHRRLRLLRADGTAENLGYAWGELSLCDRQLWKVIAELKLDFLGIDALASGSPGVDENDKSAALPLQYAKELAETVGTSSGFVHHARKDKGGSDDRESVRGSSTLFASCDAVYKFAAEGEGRVRMFSIKTRRGKKPLPVSMQLTDDRGMTLFEERPDSVAAAAVSDTPDGLAKLVRMRLLSGPMTKEDLRARLGKNRQDVVAACRLLKDRGDAIYFDRQWHPDGPEERTKRIVAAIVGAPVTARHLTTAARLARAAHAETDDVLALEQRGQISRLGPDDGCGYFVPRG